MTGHAEGRPGHDDARGRGADPGLNPEGAGMGMGEEKTTFEPEEAPEAVDEPDERRSGSGDTTGSGGVVDPRELVPDDDRIDELESPRELLPDAERGVDDTVSESESERLLPDAERPVPGGPSDDD